MRRQLGGRVAREGQLPGLAEWTRVRDWRVSQIEKLPNVSVYLESALAVADIREFGADQVVLATGSHWRADGVGRHADRPLHLGPEVPILTPDDIMAGESTEGEIVVYDDDHYYMGAVLAEKLARIGCRVTLVTPASDVSAFTINTLENLRTAKHLHALGVELLTHRTLLSAAAGRVALQDVRTGEQTEQTADGLVLVTARLPDDQLFHDLRASDPTMPVARIGDCEAPAAIFAAVYSGHRFAQDFDGRTPLKRERIVLDA
jgi:dimethylamine/trimethylamine dehydrogenase